MSYCYVTNQMGISNQGKSMEVEAREGDVIDLCCFHTAVIHRVAFCISNSIMLSLLSPLRLPFLSMSPEVFIQKLIVDKL